MLYNIKNIDIDEQALYNKIIKNIISKGYNTILYKFSDKFELISDIESLDYSGKLTDFNNMINEIPDNSIILTDGASNHGPISFDLANKNNINILGLGQNKSTFIDISIDFLSYDIYNDSIKVEIEINNNLSSNLYNQGIYLSNSINTDLLIANFDLSENSYKISKSVLISKKNIAKNNIIYIADYSNESNLINNSFSLTIEDDYQEIGILLVSGSISSNTKYIKNNILSNLSYHKINHLYRLSDNIWNKNISDVEYSDYELIVFDNFPKNKADNITINSILENYNGKISYFLGPGKSMQDNSILDLCDCKYESLTKNVNNSKNNLIPFNGKSYPVPTIILSHKIICPDNKFVYDNSNSLLYLYDNIALFFIPNIFEFNQTIATLDNNKNYLVNNVFEDFIYSQSKYINIFLNGLNHEIGDTLSTFIEISDSVDYNRVFIDIFNEDRTYEKRIISNDFMNKFININQRLDTKGNFFVQAFLESEYNNLFESNTINYNVIESNVESQNLYLHESFLSNISNKTGGAYYKYSNIDKFLDNIDLSNVNSVNYKRNKMISYPFIFIILICLFSFEWFLRNKIGLL
tara:strand:+ start:135 stop:1877 length:1743 start_codon:yes stop_codon:yes gene_type:complete